MNGGYFDDGWHGGGGACPVCGRELDGCGTCRCVTWRLPTFDEFVRSCTEDTVNDGSGEWEDRNE